MINNIILHHVAFRCILPPGWGALSNRNHIFHLSNKPIIRSEKNRSHFSEAGSWKLEVGVASLLGFQLKVNSRQSTVCDFPKSTSLISGIQAPHFVRCSIPDMRISLGEFFFEHCEAVLEC
jgi:hypothetical protein